MEEQRPEHVDDGQPFEVGTIVRPRPGVVLDVFAGRTTRSEVSR
jgi:hypothetical protein